MAEAWAPVEQVAKNAAGEFQALVGGTWRPVKSAAKSADGKYMALGDFAAVKAEGQVVKAPREQFVPSGERITQEPPTGIESLGRGMADVTQGVKQRVLQAVDSDIADTYTKEKTDENELYAKGQGGEFDPARLSGNLMFTAPANAIPGGAATGMSTRMASNAAAGGASGAAMFAPEGSSWTDNALTGAAIGAAVPPGMKLASKAGGIAYHGLIEPWANPAAIKGRAYVQAAGDKADEIINLLTKNKQLVAGSAPTAGEAAVPAGRAEFSALDASAGKINPSDRLARTDAQNAARIAAIDEFAGTPAKMAEADARRTKVTKPLYERGTARQADDSVAFDTLLSHPSMKAAVSRAEHLIAEETGSKVDLSSKLQWPRSIEPGSQPFTGAEAQKIKLAFDDLLKLAPKNGIETAELRALENTRKAYIAKMEEQFPELARARALYKARSVPINEMEVGSALKEKLVPALRDDATQRAGVFAGAARDSAQTIKSATGQPRFHALEDVLTNRGLQNVKSVTDDLARSDRNTEMARRGSAAAPNAIDLATANLRSQTGGTLPNLLHRGVMLANAIINRMEGKVNAKLAAEMATEMLDPPKVGEALAAAQARAVRNKLVAEEIMKLQRPATVGAATITSQGAQ